MKHKRIMALRVAFISLLAVSTLATAEKQQHTYQKGTITGWNTQHYSRAFSIGGQVSSAPGHKKFYELKGAGTTYQLDDCGSFQAGQSVGYRVEGKKVYIQREDGKEHKCRIEGVRAEAPSNVP